MIADSLKIAVYGQEFQLIYVQYLQVLFDRLKVADTEIWVYKPFYEFFRSYLKGEFNVKTYVGKTDLPTDTAFMLSLGGDGTMLAAVAIIADSGIPVTGINLGRLGFLASINKDDIVPAIDSLLLKEFTIQQRSLIQVKAADQILFGGQNVALNDITILKRDTSAMITVHAYLNKELLNAYWADGLIIATPTGSTAYSLSCGGPIIMPGSGNFVITPISPHNLNVRPMVISDGFELDIMIESRSDKFLLSCDSRTESLDTGTEIHITRAPFNINLIRLKQESYFNTLRQKLLWGLDTRNY
ncbi:NAD+ kinase [bacterium A37T11]|nr:NAD+ kinase [bacterium A37T11]